ncbi:TonB-dependent receptor [Sphingomonas glacialis]|uniref:TonB-dependent receptor n=1 Tax=Sphingomonas glacialis TaxID=658225 RepID=A0ABQ3LXN7_9SPHN|nr:TonB-dependent receptor [Sphingomonas glacialis]GHH23997.1 TonB-dependent receptor [Sphingomonas glacialis]
MKGFRTAGYLASVAAGALLASNASAQQATTNQTGQGLPSTGVPATSTSQPAPTQSQTVLSSEGDIIVTANKREESLNRVGLSVTAISGDALAARKITSAQDIAAVVPGLKYSESGTSTPIYTLRGVGFNESSLGVYPSVSVYTDEVPLPFPVLTLHSAYDLQRLEALKGPQGTLFGENATGGAINYITNKPTAETRIGADLSYGRFNEIDGNAYISGAVTDTVNARLAITGSHRDGWQTSYTRPNDRNGAVEYIAARFSTSWEPTSALRFLLSVNGWKDTSEPQAAQLIAIRPQQPANVQPVVQNYPFSPQTPTAADWSTGFYRPSSNRRFVQGSLRADLDLGTFATLTSLTSYLYFDQRLSSDEDGTSALVADLTPSPGNIRSFYQELRLANASKTNFRWVVGANYEKSRTFEDQTLRFLDGSSSNPGTLGINSTGSQVTQRLRNYAAFANVQYDLSTKLTLKAGGRYTNTQNRADLCGTANGDGKVAALFNALGGLLGTVPFTPIGPGGCYVLNFQGVPGDHFTNTLAEHNFSWIGGVDYHVTSDTLLYANVSRGYKAGSYPTLSASSFSEYIPVKQESVTSYEAGVKTALADRRIRLNAAVFYYDYKDKQVRGKIVDPVFDVLDTLLNVPKSRIYGAEADLTLRPVRELTVQGNLTYLNSKVLTNSGTPFVGPTAYGNSCTGPGGAPASCNFTGSELPFTPKWSYSAGVDYRHSMDNQSAITAGVNLRGQTSSITTLGGRDIAFRDLPSDRHITTTNRPFVIPSYATVDAQLGFELPGGKTKVTLWGKNVLDKYYITNANHYLDNTVRFVGLPATYGITLSIKN